MGFKDKIKEVFSRGANKEESFAKESGNAGAKKSDRTKEVVAKYPYETCALCNQLGCDVKWGGQYWHKKCLRNMRKAAGSML